MRKLFLTLTTHLLIASLSLIGCSKTEHSTGAPDGIAQNNKASTISDAPVTIRVTIDSTNLDDDFIDQLQENLKKKHPNITLEYIKPGKGTTLTEQIAAGQTPDIIISYNGNVASYQTMDLLFNMTPLIKQHSFDLSRFEPNIIEDAKIASTDNELFGIPINLNFHALYYNKDVFDKFGAPYPTDGMLWDQVIQLAKKVTRMDGNIQYRGFDPGSVIWPSQPLGIAVIDYKTDQATVNTEQWRKVFDMLKTVFSIPGNERKGDPKAVFLSEKSMAMYANLSIFNELEAAAKNGLNWDIVQYPSYPEKPNIYGNASVNMMMITKTSKYKDQALQVISVATSDEQQLDSAKLGRVTPMKDQKFKTAFGTGRDGLKGKNVQSIFKSRPVKYPVASKYRSKAEGIVQAKFFDYSNGNLDLNTAISQTEEEINKMVAKEKGN